MAPVGGVSFIAEIVTVDVPLAAVYNTGSPAMPSIAVLPIAAPLHDGLETGVSAAPVFCNVNDITVPS